MFLQKLNDDLKDKENTMEKLKAQGLDKQANKYQEQIDKLMRKMYAQYIYIYIYIYIYNNLFYLTFCLSF